MIPKPYGNAFDMFKEGNRALSRISDVPEGTIHHQGRSIREKFMHRGESELCPSSRNNDRNFPY